MPIIASNKDFAWLKSLAIFKILASMAYLATATGIQLPLTVMHLELEASRMPEMVNKFEKFAKENGFAIRVGGVANHISIQMYREDIKIFGTSEAVPTQINIGFYANTLTMPDWQLRIIALELKDAFKKELSKISDVSISDTRPDMQ